MSVKKNYFSVISTYQFKSSTQNEQLYRKPNQSSLKIHFVTIVSFICLQNNLFQIQTTVCATTWKEFFKPIYRAFISTSP
jgi:hypothetical protein